VVLACAAVVLVQAQAVPEPPTNVSFVVTGNTVTVQWTGSMTPGVTYTLEAGSAPALSNLAVVDTGSATTTFIAVSVPPGTYYVRVRSRSAGGVSAPSTEVVITVGNPGSCTQAPGPPTGLTAQVSGQQVTLRWNAGAGCPAQTYLVHEGSRLAASDFGVFDIGPTTTLSGSAGPATYYIRVIARNAYGVSTPSNDVTVNVGGTSAAVTYVMAGVFDRSSEPRLPVGTPYTATLTFDPATFITRPDPIGGTRYLAGSFAFETATVRLGGRVTFSIDSARRWIRIDHLEALQGTFLAGLRINLDGARIASDQFPVPFPTLSDVAVAQLVINTSTSHTATVTQFGPLR
jgi:hypothetical protein